MLETIWFALWGVLWAVYFMLDGFDLGLGTLRPFLARNQDESRVVLNAMGPFWDGNEVWLLTAGGVTFAAFPGTYAVMFSSLYTPLMLLLFALILRGISFEFRGKEDAAWWRKTWDACMWIGSFLPALLLGVAFANIFAGIPIDGEGVFHGNLFTLLNPYGLLGGVLFVLLFTVHGALWLAIKSEGWLRDRAGAAAKRARQACAARVAAAGGRRPRADAGVRGQGQLVEGVVRIIGHDRRRDVVRRGRVVSGAAAVEPRPGVLEDSVQLGVDAADAQDHARRGAGDGPGRDRLSGLGVPAILGPGDGRGAGRRSRVLSLARGETH